MGININAGYGRLLAESIAAHHPKTGKVYFVATTSVAGWEEFSEMFPTGPEGNTRVFTTLKGLLDADVIEDGGDDIVYVLPNHTENVTSAGALDTGADSAGLTIIGLGEQDERPLLTFSGATTADLNVGSNGVTFENLRFDLTGIDALAGPLDINDSGCTFRKCEFITADSGGQCVTGIVTDNAADYLTIDDCKFYGKESGNTSAVRLIGSDYVTIKDSFFEGDYKVTIGAIEATTTAVAFLNIKNCEILNNKPSSVAAMNFVNGSTVTVVGCRIGVRSGTTPITLNEGANGNGGAGGRVLTGGNWFRGATTIAAGTLL